ncbi:hypothetical protein N0V86_001016 [Didymella sp. IMI 355093]|nr:hypothetical protein N0V86_001016 [Didymella sp. IMI 355093]
MVNQDGLEWVEGTFGLEPHWTREPDTTIITQIVQKHLQVGDNIPIDVSLEISNAFSKLYKVSFSNSAYFFRVTLPVDPKHRTESTVANIKFMSSIPSPISVPSVIAFSSDNSNELGFEWVLMRSFPGGPLHKAWRKMSWTEKESITRQLAQHQAQLFKHMFQKIGNLYTKDEDFVVDQLVTTIHYQGDHITRNIVRGPFTSSHQWLKARLEGVLGDQQQILSTSCDEDELEDASFAHALATQLQDLLPTVFLPHAGATEQTALFHTGLHMHNITIGPSAHLTITDCEAISAVPLWRAAQLPALFDERIRHDAPDKSSYAADSDEEDDKDDDGLDNEGITDLYWEHLLEYEMTQLRKLFVAEMQKESPEWVVAMEQSVLKANFERAVEDCDNGWRNKVVKQWVDWLVGGENKDLWTMLYSYPEVDQMSQTSMDWEKA